MPYGHPESDYEFFDSFVKQHLGEFGKFAFYIVRDYDCTQDGIQNSLEAIMKYYDRVRDFDDQRLYRYCLAIIKHECIRVATGNRDFFLLYFYSFQPENESFSIVNAPCLFG